MESKKEFDFAEWAKVIDDHPAFMKKLPDSQDGEMPEAFEALQAMKYCDDDDTPEDRAKLFKEDGNKHFQYKKYRFAIEAYTKGIALRCCDKELNGILYGNRAASHVRLGNLRSAMRDCFLSRKFNPDNIKVIIRGIECMLALKAYENAVNWCNEGLAIAELLEADKLRLEIFKTQAQKLQKVKSRDDRKEQISRRKEKSENQELLHHLKARNIQFWFASEAEEVENLELECLDVPIPNVGVSRVHVVENHLVWPVLFLYPESGQTDYVVKFDEETSFGDTLSEILAEPPPWDGNGHYKLENVEVFAEDFKNEKQLVKIHLNSLLKDVTTSDRFRVKHGLPTFILLSKSSSFFQEYLSKFNVY